MIKGNLQSESFEMIEDILDTHDCHLSPMDGCICIELRAKLAQKRQEMEKSMDEPSQDIERDYSAVDPFTFEYQDAHD